MVGTFGGGLGHPHKSEYVRGVSATDDSQKPPSLRIRELTITNFRTFVEKTTISFCDADGNADAIAVFHGDNGSGKSNALAALDQYFLTIPVVLGELNAEDGVLIRWNQAVAARGQRSLTLPFRDRPHGVSGPMVIEVEFADPRLGRLRAVYTPSGEQVRVNVLRVLDSSSTTANAEFGPIPKDQRDLLRTWFSTAKGLDRSPFTVIDNRRSPRGSKPVPSRSLMPNQYTSDLFYQSTSRTPEDRDAWRFFKDQLNRFRSFKGKEISIERAGDMPELVIEDRGKTVLGLDELSSGEQHVIVLCAASLLARSSILAIEEPEISLDTKNQNLLRAILQELSDKNIIDQIILESHVALFDGPNVIRFARNENGSTSVQRGPSLDASKREIERQAKEKGADHLWVTRDGYTKLPDKMVNDLGAQDGGHVWFLKGPEHWEAWKDAEVDTLLRGDDGHDD